MLIKQSRLSVHSKNTYDDYNCQFYGVHHILHIWTWQAATTKNRKQPIHSHISVLVMRSRTCYYSYVSRVWTPIWFNNNGIPSISVRIDNDLLVLGLLLCSHNTKIASFFQTAFTMSLKWCRAMFTAALAHTLCNIAANVWFGACVRYSVFL